MDQRLSFITLGVEDLEAMRNFYSDTLGWTPLSLSEGIVFYKLNGLILGLFPAKALAEDAQVSYEPTAFKGFSLALNFASEAGVDACFADLQSRGVQILKTPQKVFWGGYHFYFSDIEGNLWEVAYNPFLQMDAQGNVLGHD